ncbi:MAG: hypothetical protein H7101_09040 [Deinococcales bacterium]|nr:hypothetical protein [Chitinophagaceae bacterium]
MTALTKTNISITEIVNDIMIVNVNCASLIKNRISYIIRNNANKLIRKGNFTGYNVQLCMTHLEDGNYEVDMFVEDELYLNIPFEKRSMSANSLTLAYH